jgi:hypothetical protein
VKFTLSAEQDATPLHWSRVAVCILFCVGLQYTLVFSYFSLFAVLPWPEIRTVDLGGDIFEQSIQAEQIIAWIRSTYPDGFAFDSYWWIADMAYATGNSLIALALCLSLAKTLSGQKFF